MYDAKNEAHEFVGVDRASVVAEAVDYFGAEEAELAIAELAESSVNGLAGRVVIVAALRARQTPSPGPGRGERGGRGDRGERSARGDRGDRRARGDRGGRGGRSEGRERGGRGDRGRRPERGGTREASERPERAAPERSEEPSVGSVEGESLASTGEFVKGLVERLDIGPFQISESLETNLQVVAVTGEAARALTFEDGRPVEALQLIANQAALQANDDAKRVVLDVEGSAEARESFLTRLVSSVVRRARDSNRSMRLDPMNGRDRRIIHLAVRELEGVASMSVGEGQYRQVVVVPEGAPEYEEAHSQSEAAANAGD